MKRLILSILLALLLVLPASAAVTTGYPTVNDTTDTDCVRFYGTYTGSVPVNVWFEFGVNITGANGFKTFKTPNQTMSVAGNFSYLQCGIPLLSSKTYIYRAVAAAEAGSNLSFVMPTLTVRPTLTYMQYAEGFLGNNEYGNNEFDGLKLLTYDTWRVYLGAMGGLFFGILLGFIFINLAMKQKSVVITVLLFFLVGSTILVLLPAAFVQLAQMLIIAAVAGMLYWMFVKRR